MVPAIQRPPQYVCQRAVATVDAVQGIIRGYIAIWGSPVQRDAYDTWWDRERPAEIGMEFVPFPLCYEHGQDGVLQKEIVGSVDRIWIDDNGYAFEGKLDRSSLFFERMVSEVQKQELFTSSSTGEHIAEFYPDGAFKTWLLTEHTLTKNPAETRMPAVQLVRSTTEQPPSAVGGDGLPGEISTEPVIHEDTPTMDLNALIQQMMQSGASAQDIIAALAGAGYSAEELMSACQQAATPAPAAAQSAPALAAPAGAPAPAAAPAATPELGRSTNFAQLLLAAQAHKREVENANLRAQLAAAQAANNAPPPPETRSVRVPAGSVSVGEPRKFDGRSRSDLMFAYMTLRNKNARISPEFLQVLAGRTADAIEKKEGAVLDLAFRSVMPATRADEIMTSTNTGNGDEWVGVGYSNDLWEKARNNRIYQDLVSRGMRVEEVPDGEESIVIFTESTDPTVYTIAQTTDLDATNRPTVNILTSNVGTGNVTLTPGQLGLAAAYSDVFEEDSLIKAAPQLNRQISEKMEETIEQLMVNGDVQTSTTNVNYDGGTPGTGLSTPYYIASDGFRKYALVTGSNTSRSGGTLDENDFRLTLKLFPSAIRTRKGQIAFLFDPDTHNTALDIAAIKTEDVKRTNATIVSGVLENIYGVDCFECGFLPLADTDGKVTYNGNVADTGTILGIYAPFWAMGWKRKITVETDRDILSGTNIIVAKMRLGFKARGAGAAVATYAITIQ